MLADNHALIDLGLSADHHFAAIFQVPERIGDRIAIFHRDQHTRATAGNRPLIGGPTVEHAVQNAGAARIGEEFAVITDQAARRHMRDDPGLACACGAHLDKLALARAGEFLDHRTGIFVIHVDGGLFDGLHTLPVFLAHDDLRTRDRKLEPFAAHVLDQNAHLKLATARHFEGFAARCVGNLDRDVGFGLFHQAIADDAALDLFAITARKRTIVDAEGDGDRRRVDGLGFEGFIHGQRTDRIGHGGLGHARNGDDVAGLRLFDVLLGKTTEGLNLGDAELLDLLADAGNRLHRRPDLEFAGLDTASQDAAYERVGPEGRCQHAEILALMGDLLGRGDVVHDEIEQRVQILARPVQLGIGPAIAPRGIHMRKVELILVGIERCKEIETFIKRAVGFGVGLVDLVEHDDGAQAKRQRLGGHEFGLRHRAFGGIDEEDHAIDHRQDPLDLAAEIGVAGGVDDVDPRAFPLDRGRLGENGDPAFALEIVGVHGALGHFLVFAERAGLFEKLIDKGRLAVVHVRDDRNITKVHQICLSCSRLAYSAGAEKASPLMTYGFGKQGHDQNAAWFSARYSGRGGGL